MAKGIRLRAKTTDGITPLSTTLASSGIANGAYAADTLQPANFYNAAGFNNQSANSYLKATNYLDFVLQSKASSRDQEVKTWFSGGTVYLRTKSDGSSISFTYTSWVGPTATKGHIRVRVNIANTGVLAQEADTFTWGTQAVVIYEATDLSFIPGYVNTGGEWTFGVQGMEIYLKYNEYEVFRMIDYRHVLPGDIRYKNKQSASVGLKYFNMDLLATNPVYASDFENKIIHVTDFGFREGKAVGTITQGSNQLILSQKPKVGEEYKPGDWIMIPIGFESGAGLRSTHGVGGTWPELSYPDEATMDADLSRENGRAAYVADGVNNYVYGFHTSTPMWTKLYRIDSTQNVNHDFEQHYYHNRILPIPLRAKVTAVSGDGLTITLDKTAAQTATNADIYYDNSWILNKLGADTSNDKFIKIDYDASWATRSFTGYNHSGYTYVIPKGNFAIGEPIYFNGRSRLTVKGLGKETSVLFTPAGFPCAWINFYNCPNTVLTQLKIKGNAWHEKFGSTWWFYNQTTMNSNGSSQIMSYVGGSGDATGWGTKHIGQNSGVLFATNCGESVHKDCIIEDVYTCHSNSYSTGVRRYRLKGIMTEGVHGYYNWAFNDANSAAFGYFEDCEMDSVSYIGSFQAWAGSYGQIFRRCKGINGTFSMNNATHINLIDCEVTLTAGCVADWIHPNAKPMMDINTNGWGSDVYGINVINPILVNDGYLNTDDKDIFSGIMVSGKVNNFRLVGGSYTAPNWVSPCVNGPIGFATDISLDVHVEGFTVTGVNDLSKQGNWQRASNIIIKQGTVKNCSADRIFVTNTSLSTLSGNTYRELWNSGGLVV